MFPSSLPIKKTSVNISFHGELNNSSSNSITIDNQDLWKNVQFNRPSQSTVFSIKKQVKQLQKLPIFVIISHGEFAFPVKIQKTCNSNRILKKDRVTKNAQWLYERPFTGNICKEVPENTYVAYHSIAGTNALVTENENKYIQSILKNPSKFKKQIFQNHKNLWSKLQQSNKLIQPDYFSPGSYYPDKLLLFSDNPEVTLKNEFDDESGYWDWYMGILPIIDQQFNKRIPCLSHTNEDFPLSENKDMENRIFNDIRDYNWSGRSDLKKRYETVTQLIKKSLPKIKKGLYKDSINGKQYGRGILLSDIMKILGPGMYITLNCSPLLNISSKQIIARKLDNYQITKLKQLEIKEQYMFQYSLMRMMAQLSQYSNYLSQYWLSDIVGTRRIIRHNTIKNNCMVVCDEDVFDSWCKNYHNLKDTISIRKSIRLLKKKKKIEKNETKEQLKSHKRLFRSPYYNLNFEEEYTANFLYKVDTWLFMMPQFNWNDYTNMIFDFNLKNIE